jgi:hypothetical protein
MAAIRPQQGIQHAVHSLSRIEDMTLCPAKRGKTENRELGLQLTDILTAQRKIVGKISGAAAMRLVQGQWALQEGRLEFQHVRGKRDQLF